VTASSHTSGPADRSAHRRKRFSGRRVLLTLAIALGIVVAAIGGARLVLGEVRFALWMWRIPALRREVREIAVPCAQRCKTWPEMVELLGEPTGADYERRGAIWMINEETWLLKERVYLLVNWDESGAITHCYVAESPASDGDEPPR
jgi:hypothetical protein